MSQGGAAPLGAVGSQPTPQAAPQGVAQGTAFAAPLPVGQSPISPMQNPNRGPLAQPAVSTLGGPAGGMQPFSQQSAGGVQFQLAKLAAQQGGKGGMPGAQKPQGGFGSPPPAPTAPMQQQAMGGGLASLLKPPQSSTNSLQ